jgi:hypothetical protein
MKLPVRDSYQRSRAFTSPVIGSTKGRAWKGERIRLSTMLLAVPRPVSVGRVKGVSVPVAVNWVWMLTTDSRISIGSVAVEKTLPEAAMSEVAGRIGTWIP